MLSPGGGHLQLPGNPSDEHLPGTPGKARASLLSLCCPDVSSLTDSRARAGRHGHGQDHLLVPTADSGPAGPHGRPHQLRALSYLQQLHLCVSVSQQPGARQTCARLADWKNLDSLGSLVLGKALHLQQINAASDAGRLHPSRFCVTADFGTR